MRTALALLVLLAAAAVVLAVGDQAYLGIFAETKVMRMAGMPPMPALPPGVDLSKIPGMRNMPAMPGAPQRLLDVRLWSPGIAPQNAFAYVAPPEGLKQGNRLDLNLYRPQAEKVEGGTFNPDAMPDFTVKIYWGSSPTVKPGQPKVIHWGNLTPEQKELMKRQASRAARGSYFYKPDWTTGYWPTDRQPGRIADDASLLGNYALTTNYTGNVSIEAPANVDFLAPIEIGSPDLQKDVPLEGAIGFAWQQIPNALGLHAMITGMEGKNTLVIWNSSEVDTGAMMGVDWGYLEMAQVREFVKQTVMMKGDRTSVTVPAGIFKNCQMPMFMMVGYGPGAALATGQPLPRIQTKTTINIMLGGKAMRGMGPMGPGE
jgi:hypothetical protein